MGEPFQYLLVTVKVVSLEKIDFSETQSPKTGCSDIDSRRKALSPY